jgi:hypothetical protein
MPGVALGCLFLNVVLDSISKVIHSGSDTYEGLIVGVVVVVAVAFSQLRGAAGRGKRFFPGALGTVAVVTLSLFTAAMFWLWVGRGAAIAAALVSLVALSAAKHWETRRGRA